MADMLLMGRPAPHACKDRTMSHYFNAVVHWVEGFGVQEFLVVFAVAVAAGVIFLRGFGSRNSY